MIWIGICLGISAGALVYLCWVATIYNNDHPV